MHKVVSQLQLEINGKEFRFYCPGEASLGELFDALTKMRAYAIERVNSAENCSREEAEKPADPECEAPKEEN